MPPDYDTSDPLQLLMAEWTQAGRWFWVFLSAGTLALLLVPRYPHLALLVAIAGFGQVLLRLGSTVIVATNELRKELRHAPANALQDEDAPFDRPRGTLE